MNIHLPEILMFTRGTVQGFDPLPNDASVFVNMLKSAPWSVPPSTNVHLRQNQRGRWCR